MPTYATSSELPPEITWFKSSYSDGNGQNCIEVADLTDWFKSSYSDGVPSNCLEVADLTPHPAGGAHVGIRDSKNPDGPAVLLGRPAWQAFLTAL